MTIEQIQEYLDEHVKAYLEFPDIISLPKDEFQELRRQVAAQVRNADPNDFYGDQISWCTHLGEVIIKESPID